MYQVIYLRSHSLFTFTVAVNLINLICIISFGYHYCTTSFIKAWIQVLPRFKSCSRSVGDSRWWGSLIMVPTGDKAKRLSSVNHTTKLTQFTNSYLLNDTFINLFTLAVILVYLHQYLHFLLIFLESNKNFLLFYFFARRSTTKPRCFHLFLYNYRYSAILILLF